MKKINETSKLGLYIIFAVAIFSLAIVLSASGRYFFKASTSEISVTGSASLNFTSDLVVWSGEFIEVLGGFVVPERHLGGGGRRDRRGCARREAVREEG